MTEERKPKRADNKGRDFYAKQAKELRRLWADTLRLFTIPPGRTLRTSKTPSQRDQHRAAVAAARPTAAAERARLRIEERIAKTEAARARRQKARADRAIIRRAVGVGLRTMRGGLRGDRGHQA